MGGERLEVAGIGDVELPVHLHPERSGPNAHGKFRLRNVVHVPGSLCNIVGGPSDDDYAGMQFGGLGDSGKNGQLTGSGGRRLAYLHRSGGFFIIKLSAPPIGPVVGESPFREGGGYLIHAFWPESEHARWAEAQEAAPAARYTAEERNWLQRNWGGEFHFLGAHGLSIYKEDDREEGRRIVRAMMRQDEM
jgi:hypothetical protein